MRRALAVLSGTVIGGAVGFFVVTALVGEFGDNGQAGIAALVLGVPPGVLLGALTGWLATRRRPAPA
jgi:hypothetical protein